MVIWEMHKALCNYGLRNAKNRKKFSWLWKPGKAGINARKTIEHADILQVAMALYGKNGEAF